MNMFSQRMDTKSTTMDPVPNASSLPEFQTALHFSTSVSKSMKRPLSYLSL
jgi:hypothetical protein